MNWSDPRVKQVCFNWLQTISEHRPWTEDQLVGMAASMVQHLQDVDRDQQQLFDVLAHVEKTPNRMKKEPDGT